MSDKPAFPPISSEAVGWEPFERGRFGSRFRHLTRAAMGDRPYHVGVAIEELPPGKQSCPFHFHMLEEEHLYVLEGECTLRLGSERLSFKAGDYAVFPAGEKDFDTEWLSLVLGIKVVSGLDEAIDHITAHSTAHSDGILTRTDEHAQRFIAEVDSAAVYVNASTRFTDGTELGLGAEVAVSTQRLHARGPMALRELTTYKWVIVGNGHVRA